MKTALVVLARNEDNYIYEFLNYYLALGFDDIFVYRNNWKFELIDSANYQNVHISDFPSCGSTQLKLFNKWIAKYYQKFDWVAFFDIDEFLVLKKTLNIKKFLEQFQNSYSIHIYWRMFGDSGLTAIKDGKYSVIDRFNHSDDKPYKIGKSILNLKKSGNTQQMIGHISGPAKPTLICQADAELAHYFSKTFQEFVERKYKVSDRSIAKHDSAYDSMDFLTHMFNEKNKNTVKNTMVQDFYKQIIAQSK